jgi:hypothetical protein
MLRNHFAAFDRGQSVRHFEEKHEVRSQKQESKIAIGLLVFAQLASCFSFKAADTPL